MTWSRCLVVSLFLVGGAQAAKAQPGTEDCVHLRDSFSQGEDLREILRGELANMGLRFVDSADEDGCFTVQVKRLADDVAVLEIDEDRARVVDLGPIDEDLRPRSLALTLAEELNSLRTDLPPLRPAADPEQLPSPVPSDPEPDAATVSEDAARRTTVPAQHEHAVSLAGTVDYLFDTSQPLFGGKGGAEFDLGLGSVGRFRVGVEGAFGSNTVSPFGEFDFTVLGASVGWLFSFRLGDVVSLGLLPELGLSVAWAEGQPQSGATLNETSAVDVMLRATLTALVRLHLSRRVALELGPSFGWVILPVEVLGPMDVLGGLSGPSLGGRLGVLFSI